MIHHIPSIYIAETENIGRGVFTTEEIPKNSVIETCPVIITNESDLAKIHDTKLHDYYFLWGENQDQAAIALGYGSLYNHSDVPNADFEMEFESGFIIIKAIRKIKAGEEIRIDYHAGLKNPHLWF